MLIKCSGLQLAVIACIKQGHTHGYAMLTHLRELGFATSHQQLYRELKVLARTPTLGINNVSAYTCELRPGCTYTPDFSRISPAFAVFLDDKELELYINWYRTKPHHSNAIGNAIHLATLDALLGARK
jgi:hypothetical protein